MKYHTLVVIVPSQFLCIIGNAKLDFPKQNEIHPSLQAEMKMALLIVHHDTFFNLSDHLTPYIKNEFKGNNTAKKFFCGRTKTAAIINCIGDDIKNELLRDMKSIPFSIMVNGSNDAELEKMFPISARIFDVNYNQIMTKFFDMNMLEGRDARTAKFMFSSIDRQLTSNDLSWDKVSALGLDNTNANIEDHNSIKSRALEKNPEIVISGCPCHILHNASAKAAEAFGNVTGFSVEDHCVDLFYWFAKSSKRNSILKEYYEFCDQDY